MNETTRESREERFEELVRRRLDGELSPSERTELAAIVTADPAARRRLDEYVALEGLLFAIGSSDRANDPEASRAERDARRGLRPGPASVPAPSGLPAALAALLLAAVILAGIAAPPPRRPPDPRTTPPVASERVRITGLSAGHLAVALQSQDPNVQIVWLYRAETIPEERTP